MARRLIGTGTTNSQGIATCTYTGVGAGEVDVVAVSGSLVSEIYEVTDCKRYVPILQNALEYGSINEQGQGKSSVELSNEWHTTGDYSIKGTCTNWGWFRWILYETIENPTITFDVKTDTEVRGYIYVNGNDSTNITIPIGESTQTITFDTTSITVQRVELRIVNTTNTSATVYIDNIRLY